MKSKRTIKKKMCILVMLSFLAYTLVPLNIISVPEVNATQEDLDNALTWAKAYLDRSYTEFNSTYAAMRDMPGLPFVMQDVSDNKWMCPAKATQAVQDGNDGPDWAYFGGCGIDVIDWGYDSDTLKLRYRWDTECDSTFDGVVMYVELVTLDNVNMMCYAIIEAKNDADHCALWFDNETVIDPVALYAHFTVTHAYGWFTTRFVVRHGTKIAANMYNALGDTDKAEKLLNMWYGSGYTEDTYDGVWGASNTYDDYEWDTGLGGMLQVLPWTACEHIVIPDYEIWGNIPWFQMGQDSTEHSGIPYRSQLQNLAVRILGFETGPPIISSASWWACGFTYKMAWACHLLNKYGVGDWVDNSTKKSMIDEAKKLVDDVSWNGYGINCETMRVGPSLVSLYQYSCYVPYADAEYLAALTKYWQLTGDPCYGQRADEVAGILLQVQVKPGDKIRFEDANGLHLIWRPDHTGGFLCGYKFGGGTDFGSSPWLLADKYFWMTMAMSYPFTYNRDYAEYSSCGWTNHETTLMCYAALYQYNQTGRTPLTSEAQFMCPFPNAKITVTTAGAGCSVYTTSGNMMRLGVTGTSNPFDGERWIKVTYTWVVTLPAMTDFRTRLTFYSGVLHGWDGNAIERSVEIYKWVAIGPQQLLCSDYAKVIDAFGSGETYVICANMTQIPSLSAGTYTIKLTFRFSCGWASYLWVGRDYVFQGEGLPLRPIDTEPFQIISFGYDYNVVPTPIIPKYYVHIRSSGPGTVSPYGEFLIDEGTLENVTATPDSSKYFQYWNINNTRMEYSVNMSSNPLRLYIDHDYNITAYFGDTPTPLPKYLVHIRSSGQGTVSPYGDFLMDEGTPIHVDSYPISDYHLTYWLRYWSGGNPDKLYGDYAEFNVTSDTTLVGVFSSTTVIFDVEDYAENKINNVFIYYRLHQFDPAVPPGTYYGAIRPQLPNGDYYMQIPAGTYDFKIDKVGYYPNVFTSTIPAEDQFSIGAVLELKPKTYVSGGGLMCPRLIVADVDLGIINIHSEYDVVRSVQIPSSLISKSLDNGYVKLTLIEGYPGLATSESYVDYVSLNGLAVVSAYLNGQDVTSKLLRSDDDKVFMELGNKLELYFQNKNFPMPMDSIFQIEGCNTLKTIPVLSEIITFYASMPYSNMTQYIDMDHLIRVQVLLGTNATLKLMIHYGTNYPVVEIESENVTSIEFNLVELYQHYALSSYAGMQQKSLFTGICVSTNVALQINLTMPWNLDSWHKPSAIHKITDDGNMSSFATYECVGDSLILNFEPGDPTISILFPSAPPSSVLLMLQVVFPIIALVGFGLVFLKKRPENIEEITEYAVAFIIIGVIIPIGINLMM
jgi:hypothetical protein